MDQTVIGNILKSKVVGKLLVGAFFRPNQKLWSTFPHTVTKLRPLRAYGSWLHALARMRPVRMSYFYTSFFRNKPLLELARRLCDQHDNGSRITITVLGCSIGAEVYSLLWTIRSKRPDLKIVVNAMDLAKEAVEFARDGIYPPGCSKFTDAPMFASMTKEERQGLFDDDGHQLTIKPWLKENITWQVGDASDPELVNRVGTAGHGFREQSALPHVSLGRRKKLAQHYKAGQSGRVSFRFRHRSRCANEGGAGAEAGTGHRSDRGHSQWRRDIDNRLAV
jgi:hypothetical protein